MAELLSCEEEWDTLTMAVEGDAISFTHVIGKRYKGMEVPTWLQGLTVSFEVKIMELLEAHHEKRMEVVDTEGTTHIMREEDRVKALKEWIMKG